MKIHLRDGNPSRITKGLCQHFQLFQPSPTNTRSCCSQLLNVHCIILTSSSPPSWRGLQAAISSSAPMTQDNMGLATAPPMPAVKLVLLAVPARQALKIVGNIDRSKSKIHGRLFKLPRLCFHSVFSNLFCACANKQPIMPSHHHIFLTACSLPWPFCRWYLGTIHLRQWRPCVVTLIRTRPTFGTGLKGQLLCV